MADEFALPAGEASGEPTAPVAGTVLRLIEGVLAVDGTKLVSVSSKPSMTMASMDFEFRATLLVPGGSKDIILFGPHQWYELALNAWAQWLTIWDRQRQTDGPQPPAGGKA